MFRRSWQALAAIAVLLVLIELLGLSVFRQTNSLGASAAFVVACAAFAIFRRGIASLREISADLATADAGDAAPGPFGAFAAADTALPSKTAIARASARRAQVLGEFDSRLARVRGWRTTTLVGAGVYALFSLRTVLFVIDEPLAVVFQVFGKSLQGVIVGLLVAHFLFDRIWDDLAEYYGRQVARFDALIAAGE